MSARAIRNEERPAVIVFPMPDHWLIRPDDITIHRGRPMLVPLAGIRLSTWGASLIRRVLARREPGTTLTFIYNAERFLPADVPQPLDLLEWTGSRRVERSTLAALAREIERSALTTDRVFFLPMRACLLAWRWATEQGWTVVQGGVVHRIDALEKALVPERTPVPSLDEAAMRVLGRPWGPLSQHQANRSSARGGQ